MKCLDILKSDKVTMIHSTKLLVNVFQLVCTSTFNTNADNTSDQVSSVVFEIGCRVSLHWETCYISSCNGKHVIFHLLGQSPCSVGQERFRTRCDPLSAPFDRSRKLDFELFSNLFTLWFA